MKKMVLFSSLLLCLNTGKTQELQRFESADHKFGLKNAAGQIIVPAKYVVIEKFREGLAPVTAVGEKVEYGGEEAVIDGKWGYIDLTGKEVIAPKYDEASGFVNGVAIVTLNNKEALISKTGKEIIPFKYDQISEFYDGLSIVKNNKLYGFIDNTGKEVVPVKFIAVKEFYEGLAVAAPDNYNTIGFIDRTGKLVIPAEYTNNKRVIGALTQYNTFVNGRAKVQKGDEIFYIDKKGKRLPASLADQLKDLLDDADNGFKHTLGDQLLKEDANRKSKYYNAKTCINGSNCFIEVFPANKLKAYYATYKLNDQAMADKAKSDLPKIREFFDELLKGSYTKKEGTQGNTRTTTIFRKTLGGEGQQVAVLGESATEITLILSSNN